METTVTTTVAADKLIAEVEAGTRCKTDSSTIDLMTNLIEEDLAISIEVMAQALWHFDARIATGETSKDKVIFRILAGYHPTQNKVVAWLHETSESDGWSGIIRHYLRFKDPQVGKLRYMDAGNAFDECWQDNQHMTYIQIKNDGTYNLHCKGSRAEAILREAMKNFGDVEDKIPEGW